MNKKQHTCSSAASQLMHVGEQERQPSLGITAFTIFVVMADGMQKRAPRDDAMPSTIQVALLSGRSKAKNAAVHIAPNNVNWQCQHTETGPSHSRLIGH